MKAKIIKFYVLGKESAKRVKIKFIDIYNWKKGEVWAWALKLLIVIIACIGMYFLLQIMPYLFIFGLFLLGILSDKSTNVNTSGDYYVMEQVYIARELIFTILRDNANLLEIQKLNTVEDITPTEYAVNQRIHNINFFRFIFYPSIDAPQDDFIKMKKLINNKIRQKLHEGFPNIYYPFYKNFQCFYVFNIDNDICHDGYLCIDVIPVFNEKTLSYATARMQHDREKEVQAKKPVMQPRDEDF